ncbi:hypothetical protein [Xanthomonas graminis]|nr:hypothetical protein [Xanthomonas translucens]UKE64967.1 hypothetical protein KM547_14805 [Xanthomonas translucens pv. phlei]
MRTRFWFTQLTRELTPRLLDRYSERLAGSDALATAAGAVPPASVASA